MTLPKIYVDFQNADAQGRLRLNCIGTIKDLARLQLELREGLALTLYSEDADPTGQPRELQADGLVTFSVEEKVWTATIDWNAIRCVSQPAVSPSSSSPVPVSPVDSGLASRNR